MNIRVASVDDAPRLLEIYAQYIGSGITFEYELPSAEEFAGRIGTTLQTYPYLVAEEGDRIAGYAYAHALRERKAYQWSVELSMYFDRNSVHHGLGTQLYENLIALLRRQGVRTAFACVTIPNLPSENFLLKAGFQKVGVFPNAGYKHGSWLGVAWFAKAISPYETGISPLIPFPALAGE